MLSQMTMELITLEQNLNGWLIVLERKSDRCKRRNYQNRDGEAKDVLIPINHWLEIQITDQGWTIQKKSTQVSVDNPVVLMSNDYIQAMDQVPVTFDNLLLTAISSTMVAKADAAIYRCKTKISIRQGSLTSHF